MTVQSWDAYCQLLESRRSDGSFERHERDARGNETKTTTPVMEWAHVYNPFGERVLSALANSDVGTVYRYDRYGNLDHQDTKMISLFSTDHINDERGRRLRSRRADGSIFAEYRYDVLGRVVYERNGDDWSIVSYDIDGDSRVIAESEAPKVFGKDADPAKRETKPKRPRRK